MKLYTAPLLIIQFLILSMITYILLKVKKNKVSISFTLFLINVLVWYNITFILHNIPVGTFTFFLFRILFIFLFMFGPIALNFVYEFLGRKKDGIFYGFLSLAFSLFSFAILPLWS